MKRKILSVALAVVMAASVIPSMAFGIDEIERMEDYSTDKEYDNYIGNRENSGGTKNDSVSLFSFSTGYPNTYTNTGNQALDIAGVAKTQIGYAETGDNHTKYNNWFYGSDFSAAWCAIFISWCANQAGISTSVLAKNAVASGYSTSNMQSNPYKVSAFSFGNRTPQVGDIVFIDNTGNNVSNHVGLVVDVDGSYIYTAEGNYSNKVSSVKYARSNGQRNGSSTTKIVFYAVPAYNNVPSSAFTYYVDSVSGGPGSIYLRGWVFNNNNITRAIQVHAYIDGGPGSGAPSYAIDANVSRPDVDAVHHCGEFHGYEYTISGISEGTHVVQLFANDQYTGESTKIGDYTVNVTTAQTIMDVNFFVDGYDTVSIDGIGTIQVYVNGVRQSYNGAGSYTDFYQAVTVGMPYEVKVNITNPDYRLKGVDTGTGGYSGLTGTTVSGATNVRLVICKDTGKPQPIPDGNYLIASAKDTRYYLDIEGAALPAVSLTNVGIAGPLTGDPPAFEIWTVKYNDDGFYTISQMDSAKLGACVSLDAYGASTNKGSNVLVHSDNGTDAQRWAIIKASSGDGYTIQAKCSGFALDITGGILATGTNVQQHPRNDSDAQRWQFLPYGDREAPVISNIRVTDVTAEGYTVSCTITDNVGVTRVQFPSWTEANNQDDLPSDWKTNPAFSGTKNGDIYTFHVSVKDHNNESGVYWTHIYAWDAAGNQAAIEDEVGKIVVPAPTCTLTYSPNGGTNAPAAQTVTAGETVALSTTVPTWDGYSFDGWFTKAEGGDKVTGSIVVNEDTTLYAHWTKNDTPPAPDPDQPLIQPGTVTAFPGQTVQVPVTITNNPGIAGAALTVTYDSSILTLDSIEKGEVFAKGSFTTNKAAGLVQWYYTETNEDITANGTLFTLNFTVNAEAGEGSVPVSVACKDGEPANLSNKDSDPVSVQFAAGAVTVTAGVRGDVTGDNKVLMNDVVKLSRSVGGFVTLTAREKALGDVTGDSKVLMNDVVKVARFVAGFLTSLEPTASLQGIGDTTAIQTGTVSGRSGQTVQVPVTITENPGIAGAAFSVNYNADVLTLTAIDRGEVLAKGSFTGDVDQNVIQWYYTDENCNTEATGGLFVLTFQIKGSAAAGSYPVTVGLLDNEAANLSDIDAEPVAVSFTAGAVQVGKGSGGGGGLSATVNSNGLSVQVAPLPGVTFTGGFCAAYDENGRMLGTAPFAPASETQTLTLSCDGSKAVTVKAFFLDSGSRPVTEALKCQVGR